MSKLLVLGWVKSGAPLAEGIRLFSLCAGEDHPFLKLIRHNHAACYAILVQELCRRYDIRVDDHLGKNKFRDEWPFLNRPDCPPELKILAADKISAYHNYVRAHEMLFECNNQEEQFATVKNLVENFIENREIIMEFEYYKAHGHCLGKHRVFKELKVLKALRKLSPVELMERKTKLEHNIWRISDQLKKNKQPHLQVDRERRLQLKKNELAEVERLIAEYR